jgi:hypothetical protein
MKPGIDYIYVDKADVNEGLSKGKITKAALYFTREYVYVVRFENLQVLLAGMQTQFEKNKKKVADLNKKLPDLDAESFHRLLQELLEPENIYKIAELEKFTVQLGFWIFGGIQVRKKACELQKFNIQPLSLREEIKKFYKFS